MVEMFLWGSLAGIAGGVVYAMRAIMAIPSPHLETREFYRRLEAHERTYTFGRMITTGLIYALVAMAVYRWLADV